VAVCWLALALKAVAQPATEPPPVEFSSPSNEPGIRIEETNAPPLVPPPDLGSQASAASIAGTSQLASGPPAPLAATTTGQPLLELGPIQLRPHVAYRLIYGDGIQALPGQTSKTFINQLSPGLFLQIGNHWTLDYTPTLSFYSSSQFRDTFDNAVILAGNTHYEDWTFGLSQSYVSSSQPLVETGSQTDQEIYATLLNAAYRMSSALSLELGLSQTFRFVGGPVSPGQLSDLYSWSATSWLNYQFAPRLLAGIGVVLGYDDVSVGADMTWEQLQGRVAWTVHDKLKFVLSGGFEDRQFLNSTEPNAINSIWAVSAQYQAFEPTLLSLTGSQTVTPSYYQNQIVLNSTVGGGLHQRLFNQLYLDVQGGYRSASYSNTGAVAGAQPNREDHGVFVNVRVGTVIRRRGTVSVFYNYSDNTSNENGFTYSSTQVGLELGYRL
jgi:hypothetical protein